MDARAAAKDATRERIAAAAEQAFAENWYDDVTVRAIAAAAGVSLQTVLNHFPTKDELFAVANERLVASIELARWAVAPGDIERAMEVLVDDYERTGESTWRMLAVEDRVPAVRPWLEVGRAGHQRWVEDVFRDALRGLRGEGRRRRVCELVVATDVYTWRLLRRDKGLDRAQAVRAMTEMVRALHAAPVKPRKDRP